jgi:serine/threonine-protein kinase
MESHKKKFSIDQLSSLYRELSEEEDDDELDFDDELECRYEKVKPIAVGSFKKVWKVLDSKTERYLALAELLNPSIEGAKQRFLREAKLTALLDHPNIISVYDIGVNEEGHPFFVMELKDGDSLHEMLFKKNPDQKQSDEELDMGLQTFLKVCDAIEYAHSRGILHLDIKPANIQVGEFGETRVGDWGMGQLLHGDEDHSSHAEIDPDLMNPLTISKHIRGTPGYMAPEQTQQGYEPDKRSDIFALGVLLNVILTKHSPIEGEQSEIIENTKQGNFEHSMELFSGIKMPSGLRAIIKKAMAFEMNARYQSVFELQHDLRQYLKGYPTLAEGNSWLHELRYFYHRNRSITLTALFASVLITLVTIMFVIHLKRSEVEAHKLKEQAEEALEVSNRERSRAEQMQMMYLREKQFAEDVVGHTYQLNFEVLQKSTQPTIYENPSRALAEAELTLMQKIKEDPSHSGYQQQKGLLSLIRQDFKRAYQELKAFPHGIEDLVRLCELFQNRYGKHRTLPITGVQELIEIMGKQQDRLPLLMMILAYDSANRDLGEHAMAIKYMIELFNPEWIPVFHYNKKENRLTLKGDRLNTLSVAFQPLLKTLNLTELIIRSSSFRDVSQLKGMKLKFLDIRRSEVGSLSALIGKEICEKVLIEPNKFSVREIENVSTQIEVIEKEILTHEPSQLIDKDDFVKLNNQQVLHYLTEEDFKSQDLYWPILIKYPSSLTLHALIKAGDARSNGYEVTIDGDQIEFFPDLEQSLEMNQLVEIGTFHINKVGIHDIKLRALFNRPDEPLPKLAKIWVQEDDGSIELNPRTMGTFKAIDAEIEGDFARFMSAPDKRCIGVWHGTSTKISWPVKILKPGKVKIKVVLGIPEEHIGGRVRVQLGTSSFDFEVPATEHWTDFRVFELGQLDVIDHENARLEFIPLKAGKQNVVMDLHSVIFEGEAEVIYDKRSVKILQGYDISRR